MKALDPSSAYVLDLIRIRYIAKCINDEEPADKIFNNLKLIRLNVLGDDLEKLQKLINDFFNLKWCEESKKWIKNRTVDDVLQGLDENTPNNLYPSGLSKTDSELIMEDIRGILSSLGSLVNDLGKIASKIDSIATSTKILSKVISELQDKNKGEVS